MLRAIEVAGACACLFEGGIAEGRHAVPGALFGVALGALVIVAVVLQTQRAPQ